MLIHRLESNLTPASPPHPLSGLCACVVCMCVCACVCERERERVFVCVWERERECVCERERERKCVCVCERERKRECMCVNLYWVIVYERERMRLEYETQACIFKGCQRGSNWCPLVVHRFLSCCLFSLMLLMKLRLSSLFVLLVMSVTLMSYSRSLIMVTMR